MLNSPSMTPNEDLISLALSVSVSDQFFFLQAAAQQHMVYQDILGAMNIALLRFWG